MSTGTTEAVRQANNVMPPVVGSIRVVSCTTSDQDVDITEFAKYSPYVTLQADGDDLYVAFAPSTVTDPSLSPSATSGNARCILIPNKGTMDVKLEGEGGPHNHLWVRTSTGSSSCYLRYWQSSQRRASGAASEPGV